MGNMTLFIAGIAILSLGTYLMRLGGAKLGNRLAFSERSQALLSDAALETMGQADQLSLFDPTMEDVRACITGQM